jgi:hypothetical protein
MPIRGATLSIGRIGLAIVAMAALHSFSAPAARGEMLRVGKAVPEAFSFVPLDVGMRFGIFKKYGLEIENSAYGGG